MLPYQAKNFATASEEVNHFVEQVATISTETAQTMEQASRCYRYGTTVRNSPAAVAEMKSRG